jgi:hypothetical protein
MDAPIAEPTPLRREPRYTRGRFKTIARSIKIFLRYPYRAMSLQRRGGKSSGILVSETK